MMEKGSVFQEETFMNIRTELQNTHKKLQDLKGEINIQSEISVQSTTYSMVNKLNRQNE